MVLWFSWLERLPVTQEVTGSNPVGTANMQMQYNGQYISLPRIGRGFDSHHLLQESCCWKSRVHGSMIRQDQHPESSAEVIVSWTMGCNQSNSLRVKLSGFYLSIRDRFESYLRHYENNRFDSVVIQKVSLCFVLQIGVWKKIRLD